MQKCIYCNKVEVENGSLLCNVCRKGFKNSYPKDKYHDHLLELSRFYADLIYKMHVLRAQYNKFYLSILSGILILLSIILKWPIKIPKNALNVEEFSNTLFNFQYLIFTGVGILGVGLCFLWFINIGEFRKLSTARFQLYKELEKELPFPLCDIEWKVLKKYKYKTFTLIERIIPIIISLPYILLLSYCVYKLIIQ